jgi:hypothetical protein
MSSQTSASGLHLFGTPRRMVLLGDLPAGGGWTLLLPENLAAQNKHQVLRLPRLRPVSARPPRFCLHEATPPGTYAATLESDHQAQPVTIEVTPAPRLSAIPGSVRFAAHAGAAAQARVAMTNRGNTDVVIPARGLVGLYDDDGIELAFAETYRQPQHEPDKLPGYWLSRLREGHGGMMRMDVSDGSGTLVPGASRMITVETTLSEHLRSGHSYHGFWKVGPLRLAIAVSVERNGNGVVQ